MSHVTGLRCHLCHASYEARASWVCGACLGPLEVVYDYEAARSTFTREAIGRRPHNLWRYAELLPVDAPRTGFWAGWTPLVPVPRLGAALGLRRLFVKDDSLNRGTLSYKDRVVSVAASRAVEFGMPVLACPSTGNLANSVAAHAARLGLPSVVFVPADLEPAKIVAAGACGARIVAIEGSYDDANRLCTEIADRHGWGFANINLRSYYAEGAKTMAFEIAEQLEWRFPAHVVSPVAGGTLLPRLVRGFRELQQLGLVDGELPRVHAAQAAGSAPVVRAILEGQEFPDPVKPRTIAKSLAIGNPADGFQVVRAVGETGGTGEVATDPEILAAIELLARTEGIFTEPAGGTTVAVTRRLAEAGVIAPDAPTVICVTGNGFKAVDALTGALPTPVRIGRSLAAFEQAAAEAGWLGG
ncbi:MAG: threonine synthase [Vicinamibacterales bacterium]